MSQTLPHQSQEMGALTRDPVTPPCVEGGWPAIMRPLCGHFEPPNLAARSGWCTRAAMCRKRNLAQKRDDTPCCGRRNASRLQTLRGASWASAPLSVGFSSEALFGLDSVARAPPIDRETRRRRHRARGRGWARPLGDATNSMRGGCVRACVLSLLGGGK